MDGADPRVKGERKSWLGVSLLLEHSSLFPAGLQDLGRSIVEYRFDEMSESRPKKCSHCQSPTSIHVTKVVDGEAVKMGLCSNCPKALEIKQGVSWDLVGSDCGGKQPRLPKGDETACTGCGLTPADFKEHGRLGCPKCYEVFGDKLASVIRKLHRGETHLGKVPRGRKRTVSPEEIAALKRRLEDYVNREEFEMAAQLRDQINALDR